MEREEVELLPSGLITCLLNIKEVRIMKISPERLTIRLAQEIKEINELKVIFHIFDENRYEEITIEKYNLINKEKHEFYITYVFSIKDEAYLQNVRNTFNNYTRYIRLKSYSDDNYFSNEMVGYPSEKDYDFYEDYISQKQEWMTNLNYDSFNYSILNSVELAINIDNYELHNKYLNEDIEVFVDNYLKNNFNIEIVINDWGMIKLVQDKSDYFILNLGVLLNKRKKDPRYVYKKGYKENNKLIGKNNLNSYIFNRFLNENNIKRYEYENCGYDIEIAEGNHSLHIPFYVTNTSQYCTLYAMCTTMNRGNQKLVKGCPMYCKEYIFSYPKNLKMVGRYNSIFAFDDTLLKDFEKLEHYIDNGIDRIVLNFI